jgi:hypothetical protein
MNTINRRAILAVALLVACGASFAATPTVNPSHVRSAAKAAVVQPCNPLVCSVKAP